MQKVFFGGGAIHFKTIGAVQILEKGIVQDGDDRRVLAAHRQIVDDDVIVRLAPDGHALFVQGVFFDHHPVHAQYQFCCHSRAPSRY